MTPRAYTWLKLGIAALLLICLLDMPYGYYQFVRFTAMIVFSILAYQASQKEQNALMVIFIALAILFQPLIKISLGRSLWNLVDVVVAAGLIFSIYFESKLKNQS